MKLCPKCGGLMYHNAYFPAYFCEKCGLMERGPRANSVTDEDDDDAVTVLRILQGDK